MEEEEGIRAEGEMKDEPKVEPEEVKTKIIAEEIVLIPAVAESAPPWLVKRVRGPPPHVPSGDVERKQGPLRGISLRGT